MNERQKQHLLDEQEEEFLQALFDDAMEKEGNILLKVCEKEREAGTLPQIPEELDAKCRELIRESGRKHNRIQFLKNAGIKLKRVAVIALTLLIFVSSLAMSVDAIRLPVLNFLTDKEGRYSTVLFHGKREDKGTALSEKILSAPIFEGYWLVDQWYREDGSFTLWYENETGATVQVGFVASINMYNYDIEDAEQIQTKVLDKDALFIQKNGLRVIWMADEYNGVMDMRADDMSMDVFWKYVLYIAEL